MPGFLHILSTISLHLTRRKPTSSPPGGTAIRWTTSTRSATTPISAVLSTGRLPDFPNRPKRRSKLTHWRGNTGVRSRGAYSCTNPLASSGSTQIACVSAITLRCVRVLKLRPDLTLERQHHSRGYRPVTNSFQCSWCQAVVYCSRECQREDWDELHRKECERARAKRIGEWPLAIREVYEIDLG